MKQYDLSAIMSRAWAIFRKGGKVCCPEYKTRHRALQGLCSALPYSLLSFPAGMPCSFSKSAARLLSVSGSV